MTLYTLEEFNEEIKRWELEDREHPIRAFFRRFPYCFKNWWYEQVSSRINPRQKWLKIPRTFTNVDALMETVVAQSLVNYWENDRGEETLKFQGEEGAWDDPNAPWTKEQAEECRVHNKAIYDEMKAAYDWIKSKKYWYEVTEDEEGQKHLDNIWKRRHYLWS